MHAMVFPGQGSQYKGMGEELFEQYPNEVAIADKVLGYSIKSLCLEDKEKKLLLTQYTQPAIYVVSALHYMSLRDQAQEAELLAGHSLGEYSALFAAGVFSFEEGLRAVKVRGELMGKANGGAMAAILGLNRDKVDQLLQQYGLGEVDVANYNTQTQTVVSGKKNGIMSLEAPVTQADARFIPLMVSAPFHSRFMQQASDEFSEALAAIDINPPKIEVVSSVLARPYRNVNEIRATLASQIRKSVRWLDTMHYYLARDIQKVTEVGPGTVLTKMFAEIKEATSEMELKSVREQIEKESQNSTSTPLKPAETETVNTTRQPESGNNLSQVRSNTIDRSRLNLTPRQLLSNKPHATPPQPAKQQDLPTPMASAITNEKNPPKASPPQQAQQQAKISSILESGTRRSNVGKNFDNNVALGSSEFCRKYDLKAPYVVGAMQQGISSAQMIIKLANSGLLGFFGAHRLSLPDVEAGLKTITSHITKGAGFGINIVHVHDAPTRESQLFELALKYNVPVVELSNYHSVNKNLLHYRFKGAYIKGNVPVAPNGLMVKTSRLDTASLFMSTAPKSIIDELAAEGLLTTQEADVALRLPVCSEISIESLSGWKSDSFASACLIPQFLSLRNEITQSNSYSSAVRVGVAGGLGTPESIAYAFFAGVDYVVTGSINQCTVEAETSPVVKDILQGTKIYDTDFTPFVDLFETGVKAQVLRRGVFFPSRARKLYEIYCQLSSLDEIDAELRQSLETRYFKKSLGEVWDDICSTIDSSLIAKAEVQPKLKMSLIFKHYLSYGAQAAQQGVLEDKTNFQVFCSPAMGAFNEYVKGTDFENWRNRHVDSIGFKLMRGAERFLQERMGQLQENSLSKDKRISPVAT